MPKTEQTKTFTFSFEEIVDILKDKLRTDETVAYTGTELSGVYSSNDGSYIIEETSR